MFRIFGNNESVLGRRTFVSLAAAASAAIAGLATWSAPVKAQGYPGLCYNKVNYDVGNNRLCRQLWGSPSNVRSAIYVESPGGNYWYQWTCQCSSRCGVAQATAGVCNDHRCSGRCWEE